MHKITIGLIGFGTVGSGVVELLQKRKNFIKNRFNTEFVIKTVCDLEIKKRDTTGLNKTLLTTNINDVVDDKDIDVVIELIGGLSPAKDIVVNSLNNGKHVVTANKALISNYGKELFKIAQKNKCHLYFESSVGAGIPIIKSITEGLVGNKFNAVYGIINGTCNFILSEMTEKNFSFEDALKEAQRLGYAESDPTLDINGMDSAHKLAILAQLTFGKFLNVKDIYTEGITQISHDDIEYAKSLNLTIKLLAIAKKHNNKIEARVHPTLISNNHPLASINSVYNAVYLDADPLGKILLSGEGAGRMAAASGVVSDLINYASKGADRRLICNLYDENTKLRLGSIDDVETKFYIRFLAGDKPGVLSKISGILGKQGISINSVTQKVHNKTSSVPVVMLTDYTSEKKLRIALKMIKKLSTVKGTPVVIRMEKLW